LPTSGNDRIVNAFLTKLEAKAILIAKVPEEFHQLPNSSQPLNQRVPPGDDDGK
jgi:hypothetical protein